MTLVTVEILTSFDETVALLLRRRQKPVSRIFKEESFFFLSLFLFFLFFAPLRSPIWTHPGRHGYVFR